MGKFEDAWEKMSGITGRSLKRSRVELNQIFLNFCQGNEIMPAILFKAIIEERIHIVVLSDILGPEISFVAAENCVKITT